MQTAFVTGATGLLGNNLVRALLQQGYVVRALVRSKEKAARQFAGLPVELVPGDLTNLASFAPALHGCDALFHTAAYFRDNYAGGSHWEALQQTNVQGTAELMEAAYAAGIRRVVHTSSIAVLDGPPGALIDETMTRCVSDADDYYRSKILADREVLKALDRHPDLFAVLVLPGWMFGPGDLGPTSSGQFVLDYMHRRLPGRPPGTFSVVDARDVAEIEIAALQRGRRGERYLAAGRHMDMNELMQALATLSGVAAPQRRLPLMLLRLIAEANELYARFSGKPVLLSRATVRLMARESGRTRFDARKTQTELGIGFRPLNETLEAVLDAYRDMGLLLPPSPAHAARHSASKSQPDMG